MATYKFDRLDGFIFYATGAPHNAAQLTMYLNQIAPDAPTKCTRVDDSEPDAAYGNPMPQIRQCEEIMAAIKLTIAYNPPSIDPYNRWGHDAPDTFDDLKKELKA